MKPFEPHALPPQGLDWAALVGAVGRANAAVARYDGMLQSVVDPTVLLSPLTTQEAVLSSKIEGTQATVDEVLEHEAGQTYDTEKTNDILEIVNYRRALLLAGPDLSEQPLTLSLLLQLHAILMSSVRGQDKSPGEFRRDQNWLGPIGCPIDEATFIPPNPLQLQDYLEAWEAYVQADDVDVLVQAAVVHAQFEILHPFKDGNGRIGRLLVPLFLHKKGALASPLFYLSEYLEEYRDGYYAALNAISADDNWTGWVSFFLEAVRRQADKNLARVRETLKLYEQMKNEVSEVTHSQHAIRLLDAMFASPVFRSVDFVERTGLAKQTIMPLLKKLRDAGTVQLVRESSGRRPAILAFVKLLRIVDA